LRPCGFPEMRRYADLVRWNACKKKSGILRCSRGSCFGAEIRGLCSWRATWRHRILLREVIFRPGGATLPRMTTQVPALPLRALAQAAERPIEEVYRLFRLESAPPPAAHVASVPVYDARAGLKHVLGSDRAADAALERLAAKLERRKAGMRPPAA
jgi:hypothetical protein